MTLVEDLAEITATEYDDYFTESHYINSLNNAQDHIFSSLMAIEKGRGSRVSDLDQYRAQITQTITPVRLESGFFYSTSNVPFGAIKDYIIIDARDITMKYLMDYDKYELFHGNAYPTPYEGYFYIMENLVHVYFGVPVENYRLVYIRKPEPITVSTIDTIARRAVLYYAAHLLVQIDTTLPSEQYLQVANEYLQTV